MKTSGFHCLNRRDPNKEGLNNALTKKIRYHKVIPLYITANERYWLVFSHGTVHFEEIEKGSHQRLFTSIMFCLESLRAGRSKHTQACYLCELHNLSLMYDDSL